MILRITAVLYGDTIAVGMVQGKGDCIRIDRKLNQWLKELEMRLRITAVLCGDTIAVGTVQNKKIVLGTAESSINNLTLIFVPDI